jgi:hypothetical protein
MKQCKVCKRNIELNELKKHPDTDTCRTCFFKRQQAGCPLQGLIKLTPEGKPVAGQLVLI